MSEIYTAEQLASYEQFSAAYQDLAREAVEACTAISGLTGFEVYSG